MEYGKHYSVLYKECLDALGEGALEDKTPLFADLTFGAGGHSFGLLEKYPNSKIYSVDQDIDAIKNGKEKIKDKGLENRITLLNINFEDFPSYIESLDPNIKFNGILMDLGVSSHQFDSKERGFSYRAEAKLDMRMNQSLDSISAYEVINNFSEEEIANILYTYGEEKLSRRIARTIIEARKEKSIETTLDLENIIFHCYPKDKRHQKPHPATRSFQALRIYVNRELEVIENTISKLFSLLKMEGILAIISFHSLEDRIVKHKYKEIVQNSENLGKILTKKPILPTDKEVEENSRSRSAKLRLLKKTYVATEGDKYDKKKQKIFFQP